MKLEIFEYLIEKLKTKSDAIDKIYHNGLDMYNLFDPYEHIISVFLKIYYKEEGADWIEWWLYEKFESDPPLDATNVDGTLICNNIEELWKLVEDIRQDDKYEDYVIPPELSDKERLNMLKELFA